MGGRQISLANFGAVNCANLDDAALAAVQAEPLAFRQAIDCFTCGIYRFEDFVNAAVGTYFTNTAAGSGAATGVVSTDVTRVGILQLSTGTDTTGGLTTRIGAAPLTAGDGRLWFHALIKLTTLRTAGEDFAVRIGFFDSTNASPVDGAYFLYDSTSANWQTRMVSNSSATVATSTSVVVTGEWQAFSVVFAADGSDVKFYIGETLIATHTLTIPTGIARAFGCGAMIVKSAGSTARTMQMDYASFYFHADTPRTNTMSFLPME